MKHLIIFFTAVFISMSVSLACAADSAETIADSDTLKARMLEFREKLSLQDDMKKIKADLESSLVDILSDEQMSNWRVMNEAAQQEFKQMLKRKIG